MAKGRKNWSFKDGYWTGYRDYRYGSTGDRPISLAGKQNGTRIFRNDKHRHVVDRTMDVLRDWRLSPFEHEGAVRAALRSGLCLRGYPWHLSDLYAAEVVSEALRQMGAVRPSYAQGQWEYTVARENCANCLRQLDEEDIAARRRFCCHECADAKRVASAERYEWLMKNVWSYAGKQRAKEQAPPRICARAGCGKEFKSVNEDARYCSIECFHAASVTVGERPCKQCGKIFRPSNNITAGRFCSVECTNESFRQIRVYSACACCGDTFIAGNLLGRYCSARCKKLAGRVGRGEIIRISPPVFDYVFRMAA